MFLERKLKRWVDAGLITEPTKADIVSFENQSSKSSALYGVLGIGAISIVIGIISIIAANWHNISKEMKLLANFIWLTSLAIGIFISDRGNRRFIREALILLLFGSIIGSIALIGQIYHLESHPFKAFSLWLLIGTPIILFSETKYAAHILAMALSL